MNLASLGNQTPHLHWHLIPRFADDRTSSTVWGRASAMRRRDLLPDDFVDVARGDLAAMLGAAAPDVNAAARDERAEPSRVASAAPPAPGRLRALVFADAESAKKWANSLPLTERRAGLRNACKAS